MLHDLPIGPALRRFRRLNGIKQGYIAELLSVSQASVSRWESGAQEPDQCHRDKIVTFMATSADNGADAALKRLVETSSLPVHLICDATHRLLAASPARAAAWQGGVEAHRGSSLWRFASPEIITAESSLSGMGWFERPFQTLSFETKGNASIEIPVCPSRIRWDTIPLADGRVGRLTTTLESHA